MKFYKYQGTGNDFIMIDDRANLFPSENNELIKKLCNRHFGIGADGLILLQNNDTCDFTMVYFNSDGNQSTMCGNGGRCLVTFAHDLGIFKDETTFLAIDGLHKAKIRENRIELKINDVKVVEEHAKHFFLNTGSPHHVEFLDNVTSVDINKTGAEIRYGSPYFKEGTNVNFVEIVDNKTIKVRTYERGVEGETLSCGTGVTAAAIAFNYSKKTTETSINIHAVGGDLCVSFIKQNGNYEEIYLIGSAEYVFKGELEL